jgi:uncharacterized membrane protein YagU involved in acid resistance
VGNLIRGAVAGGIATWVMDLTTTGMLQGQSPEVNHREEQARPNGKGAVTNLVDRLQAAFDVQLDDAARSAVETGIHFGLGIVPGAIYALLRDRVPLLGAGRGMLYGVLLWAVNDEILNTRLGLAGEFGAYPAETHGRGLVGHLVLGVGTDAAVTALGG